MKLNIEIDDSLREFLDEQSIIGGYGSVASYLQSLIQADKDRLDDQELYQKLIREIAQTKGDVTDEDHRRAREQVTEPRLRKLRAMIQAGVDQADRGEFVEFSAEDIMREGRELLARRKGKRDGAAA